MAVLTTSPTRLIEVSHTWRHKQPLGKGPVLHCAAKAVGLVNGLQGGRYWSITEQGKNRKAPDRLNMEQERSHTETNLSREISKGEPNSRQHTPESSPQQPDWQIPPENYQGRYQEGQVCTELLQRNKTPMENLECLQLLNPSMMGEDK